MTDVQADFYKAAHDAAIVGEPADQQPKDITADLIAALKADEAFVWSWACNLAMSFVDVSSTLPAAKVHLQANLAAARFMDTFAKIDLSKNSYYQDWVRSFDKYNPGVVQEFWDEKYNTHYKQHEGSIFSKEWIEAQRKLFFCEIA